MIYQSNPLTLLIFYTVLTLATPAVAQQGAPNGEWPTYAGDLGGTKYSGLDQIDASNFNDLRIAWRWQSADGDLDLDALRTIRPDLSIINLRATPLMVGDTVYIVTPLRLAVALDAATGSTKWIHNPQAIRDSQHATNTNNYLTRGLAYWSDDQDNHRILYGTDAGYLLAVDATTGEPVVEFGTNGRVDLTTDIPRGGRGTTDNQGRPWMSVTSAPIVARDIGGTPFSISDQPITQEQPPGWVKGIDVRTGETKWTFRTVPQADDFGADTWQNESWRYTGGTNVWSAFAVDEELGYIYLPTGTPTNDYYGGHRLGDNLFAESLVALDIETGERIWNLERKFNIDAGVTGEQDTLPKRLLKEAAKTGPAKGLVSGLKEMLPEYYEMRGWSEKGVPNPEILSKLGI